jgi:invasion protein IalB
MTHKAHPISPLSAPHAPRVQAGQRPAARLSARFGARIVGTAALGLWALFAVPQPAAAQAPEADSLQEMFRDWAVNCETIPPVPPATSGTRVCEMMQQVNHQESGQRVLAFSIRLNDAGEPVAVVIAPFGLRLSEGLRLRVGDKEIAALAFETCLPEGCLVVAPLDQATVTSMQGGSEGAIIMVGRQGEAVGVPMSFLGFTAGLTRLRALSGR